MGVKSYPLTLSLSKGERPLNIVIPAKSLSWCSDTRAGIWNL